MTEGGGPDIGFKAALSRAAGRLIEEYVGEEPDRSNLPLWIFTIALRALSAFAGVMTLVSFLIAFGEGEKARLSREIYDDFTPAFWIIVSVLPIILGYSLKRGSILRFYLIGFFLSGLLMKIGFEVATS